MSRCPFSASQLSFRRQKTLFHIFKSLRRICLLSRKKMKFLPKSLLACAITLTQAPCSVSAELPRETTPENYHAVVYFLKNPSNRAAMKRIMPVIKKSMADGELSEREAENLIEMLKGEGMIDYTNPESDQLFARMELAEVIDKIERDPCIISYEDEKPKEGNLNATNEDFYRIFELDRLDHKWAEEQGEINQQRMIARQENYEKQRYTDCIKDSKRK